MRKEIVCTICSNADICYDHKPITYAPCEMCSASLQKADQILTLFKEEIEKELLTDEDIKEIGSPYIVPTNEEWAIKPDHEYWRIQRLLKAQLQKILKALESK